MSHKITNNERFNKYVLRSVRSKVLQKLLIVCWYFLRDWRTNPNAEKLWERGRSKNPNLRFIPSNIIAQLKPEDIMDLIQVSKRTAIEYIQALRTIVLLAEQ